MNKIKTQNRIIFLLLTVILIVMLNSCSTNITTSDQNQSDLEKITTNNQKVEMKVNDIPFSISDTANQDLSEVKKLCLETDYLQKEIPRHSFNLFAFPSTPTIQQKQDLGKQFFTSGVAIGFYSNNKHRAKEAYFDGRFNGMVIESSDYDEEIDKGLMFDKKSQLKEIEILNSGNSDSSFRHFLFTEIDQNPTMSTDVFKTIANAGFDCGRSVYYIFKSEFIDGYKFQCLKKHNEQFCRGNAEKAYRDYREKNRDVLIIKAYKPMR